MRVGEVVDGDTIMAIVATRMLAAKTLRKRTVVATVMSNLGLERGLTRHGGRLARTAVGDRYVVEKMRAEGLNVGGEQSGHMILADYATTGDGLLAALQVLAVLVESGRKASEAGRLFQPLPQRLASLRVEGGPVLENVGVKAAIHAGEAALDGVGRLLIRRSGTEPVIRVMAEGDDEILVGRVVDDILAALRQAAPAQ